jgi:hypothetical protein
MLFQAVFTCKTANFMPFSAIAGVFIAYIAIKYIAI